RLPRDWSSDLCSSALRSMIAAEAAPTKKNSPPMPKSENSNATMTPREIVQALDTHIVGQQDAKRAVAIALRNRWRRSQLDDELRNEVMPKNTLMIGPTG